MNNDQQKIITVFGSGTVSVNSQTYNIAKELGYQLAIKGFSVKTGGYEGVMQGVSEGAAEANLKLQQQEKVDVIGIVVINYWDDGITNYLTKKIDTPYLGERLEKLYNETSAFVIMPGGKGTMQELIQLLNVQSLNFQHNRGIKSCQYIDKKIFVFKNPWHKVIQIIQDELQIDLQATTNIEIVNNVNEVIDKLKLI